jgi:hypothetical protein
MSAREMNGTLPAEEERRGAGADAEQVAAAMAAMWQRIDAALAPVLGSKAVAALRERSLHLAGQPHPCLQGTSGADAALGFNALNSTVARQDDVDAALACSAVMRTFDRLLGGLIGPSLAHRLLEAARADASPEPHSADTAP